MLTQSVRRAQPGKRTSGIFAKPADPLDSELWLEQGVIGGRDFTELAKRIDQFPFRNKNLWHLAS